MCNTIHNVPTRAAATKFHPVQYSNFFLLVCLGCSRWAHSLWSKIHNEFYTCNTLLFLLLSIIIIFFFMKFVFVITRHSLLMGGSTAVQKNMTDCRSNSNILKLTSHVMGKNSFVLIPKDLNYLKKKKYLEIIKLNAHTNISVWFIIKQLHSKIKHTTAAAAVQ